MRDILKKNSKMRFLSPIDGDCVNSADGILSGNILTVEVRLCAEAGRKILINSTPAEEKEAGIYTAPVSLFGEKTEVTATDLDSGEEESISLFRLYGHEERLFRISSDDNLIFLKQLTEGDYKSIFDHPYLAVYKKAHDLYGAKVHLNLFYEFCELTEAKFSSEMGCFNLSMVTDRYKEEFKKNSDWLKLAFHSRNETPRPYAEATAEVIREDILAVHREIERFAGRECISDTTTVHYGAANLECVREMRALGFRSLTGYFTNLNGRPRVSYYLDCNANDHIEPRDAWVDTEEDMIFIRIDRVLNEFTNEENLAYLDALTNDPHRGGFISIMIHEQYFYPDYIRHIANFEDLVLNSARLLYERGYRGALVSELTRKYGKKA